MAIEAEGEPMALECKYGFLAYGSEDGSFQVFVSNIVE
jgi:hypothetical protein